MQENLGTNALNCGAKGYLLKSNFESILPSIKAVLLGQTVFGSEVNDKLPNALNESKKIDYKKYDLTDKEYEIIKLRLQYSITRICIN